MKRTLVLACLFVATSAACSSRSAKSTAAAVTVSGFAEPYLRQTVIDLAQVSASATVHVTGTCVKSGSGIVSHQYCDVGGWPYTATLSSVGVDLDPVVMRLMYGDNDTQQWSILSLDRMTGTLDDLELGSVPGIGPHVDLNSISFGGNQNMPWMMHANDIVNGSSVMWSPVDGTRSTYTPSFDGPAYASVDIEEVVADDLPGVSGSLSGQFSPVTITSAHLVETGLQSGTHRENYQLDGTLSLSSISLTYAALVGGQGITISVTADVIISFTMSGTARTPWPSPILSSHPGALTYPAMAEVDGTGTITSGTLLASYDGTALTAPASYDVYVDWGHGRGYDAASWATTVVNSTTVPAAVVGSSLTITDWSDSDVDQRVAEPSVDQPRLPYQLVTYVTATGNYEVISRGTVLGPTLTGTAHSRSISLGVPASGQIATFTDTNGSATYSALVYFGDGTTGSCSTGVDGDCWIRSIMGGHEIQIGHTWTTLPVGGGCVHPVTIFLTSSDGRGVTIIGSADFGTCGANACATTCDSGANCSLLCPICDSITDGGSPWCQQAPPSSCGAVCVYDGDCASDCPSCIMPDGGAFRVCR